MAIHSSCSDTANFVSLPCCEANIQPITLSTTQLIETIESGNLFLDGVKITSINHLKEVYQRLKKEQENNPYDRMVKQIRNGNK